MVPGLNSNVDRNGAIFHVQTEDLGRTKPILQTLVYYGGEVVTVLEYTYEELATSDEFSVEEVRRKLARQHHRLIAEIDAGIFDGVDPGTIAEATEEELRQRQRILDYLESALTYDHKPCSSEAESPDVETEAKLESDSEAQFAAAAEAERQAAAEAPRPAEPAGERQSSPSRQAEAPRRLVVIRPEHDGQVEARAPDAATGPDAPRLIAVAQDEETPQPVAVRQSVRVKIVQDSERGGEEILGRLDATVERERAVRGPSRTRPWPAVAVVLVALVLVALGWRWASGRRDARVATPSPATVAADPPASVPEVARVRAEPKEIPERAVPEPVATPSPRAGSPAPGRPAEPRIAVRDTPPSIEVREVPIPAPEPKRVVVEAEKPPVKVATTPMEPAGDAPEVLPPVASTGKGEEPAAEGEPAQASLTPAVPEIPGVAPDPIENLARQSAPAVAPPEPPEEKPALKIRVRTGMLIDLASVDDVPEPTRRGFPEYPKRARKQGRQGQVDLNLLIDERGNVAEVRVADGGVVSDLSDAAIEAAQEWKYTPARKGPYKVRVWKPVTVHFVLDDHRQSRVRVEE